MATSGHYREKYATRVVGCCSENSGANRILQQILNAAALNNSSESTASNHQVRVPVAQEVEQAIY